VKKLTTGLKNFIIQTSTKQNFVRPILIVQENVSMEITVRSLILILRFQLKLSIRWIKIQTSICFTLRQSGVLSTKQTIKEINAFTHITGKISDVNLKSISITKISAGTGAQKIISIITKMVVQTNTDAPTVMGGRNKSITQRALSLIHANMEINVSNHTAHTFITIRIRDSRSNNSSRFFPKQELLHSHQITTCHIFGSRRKIRIIWEV